MLDARLDRVNTPITPNATKASALKEGTQRRRPAVSRPKPQAKSTKAGTVPNQNVPIVSAPRAGLPVPAAVTTNAYSQPQGSKPEAAPKSAPRINGGRR